MKRRMILLVGALAMVVALSVFVYWPRGPREPVYQGKRLSAWLEEARLGRLDTWGRDPLPEQDDARNAVRSAGTNALPWLMAQFAWSRSARPFNPDNEEIYELHYIEPEAQVRVSRAAIGIHLLGPAAAPVLPRLVEYFGKGSRGYSAAFAMSGAGDAALPYLRDGSLSTNPAVARQAMSGLAQLANSSGPAAEVVIQFLQHPNASTRALAAWSLVRVPSRPGLTVPALMAALTDTNAAVRRSAANSLAGMGLKAHAAIPDLLRLMNDPNREVAWAARQAVLLLDPTELSPRRP